MWQPIYDQSFWSSTIHSELSVSVPADNSQSPSLPDSTVDFLKSVWSLVASEIPATSQPDPGSSPIVPIISSILPEPIWVSAKTSSPLLK